MPRLPGGAAPGAADGLLREVPREAPSAGEGAGAGRVAGRTDPAAGVPRHGGGPMITACLRAVADPVGRDCGLLQAGAVNAAARRLRATLGFLQLPPHAPELRLLHAWADTWAGVGAIVTGLHCVGYDLDLRQYGDDHWRASFYVTGIAHSILGGSAWEPTVWRAYTGRAGMRSSTLRAPCGDEAALLDAMPLSELAQSGHQRSRLPCRCSSTPRQR
jgi:hypothetical protein